MSKFQMQQDITINSKYYLPNYKTTPPSHFHFQGKIVSKTKAAAAAAAATLAVGEAVAHIKSLCTIFQHKLPLFPFRTSM